MHRICGGQEGVHGGGGDGRGAAHGRRAGWHDGKHKVSAKY
jgi:hypothetical protein